MEQVVPLDVIKNIKRYSRDPICSIGQVYEKYDAQKEHVVPNGANMRWCDIQSFPQEKPLNRKDDLYYGLYDYFKHLKREKYGGDPDWWDSFCEDNDYVFKVRTYRGHRLRTLFTTEYIYKQIEYWHLDKKLKVYYKDDIDLFFVQFCPERDVNIVIAIAISDEGTFRYTFPRIMSGDEFYNEWGVNPLTFI